MKRVLFITSGLKHGGVNKSLLSLLKVMDNSNFEVEVFSLYQSGPYMEKFSSYNLISIQNEMPKYLRYDSSRGNNISTDTYLRIMMHFFPQYYCKRFGTILSSRSYDIVVSFQEGFTSIFATYVKAKKHIAWIHCDYSRYLQQARKNEESTYRKYDVIVAVSQYTAEVVKNILPSVDEKVQAIHNVMDSKDIRLMSKEEIDDDRFVKKKLTIVSIGRMDPVKRFSYIPSMAKKMKEAGIQFRWYIIGDGGGEKLEIQKKIEAFDVMEEVILLGEKNNPYPYVGQSDLLVCPSSSEAYPNVINEAGILHIPVVAADFPSANEIFESGISGIICPIEIMAETLIDLYFDSEKYEALLDRARKFSYDNRKIIDQISACFSD